MKISKNVFKTIKQFYKVFNNPLTMMYYYLTKDDSKRVIHLNNGQQLFITSYQDIWIIKTLYSGEYETGIKNKNSVKNILDIGGYKGYSLKYFRSTYPNAKIVVVEPNPKSLKVLKINSVGNSEIIKKAVTDNNNKKIVKFECNKGKSNINPKGNIKVSSININELLKNKHYDIVKIDVEGYESKIINSIKKENWKNIKLIIGESHNNYNSFRKTLKNNFINIDYKNTSSKTGLFKARGVM